MTPARAERLINPFTSRKPGHRAGLSLFQENSKCQP